MSVSLVTTSLAVGKIETCIQAVRNMLAKKTFAPAWVVMVPNQLQAFAFQQRFAQTGGGCARMSDHLGICIKTFLNVRGCSFQLLRRHYGTGLFRKALIYPLRRVRSNITPLYKEPLDLFSRCVINSGGVI